jgi:uncharacterized membrane protein YGL010W
VLARESDSERIVNAFFRRQMADYVEYHRDPWNCAMHVFGIITLFLAAILPLTSLNVSVFGLHANMATILALPVLIYWFLLDRAIGAGILVAALLLMVTASAIDNHFSPTAVWSMTAVLMIVGIASQIIGHQVFEQRQPALMDNPTHLLLGPMFVMAKLYNTFGFRKDLAAILQQGQQTSPTPSLYAEETQGEPQPNS